MKRSVPPPMIWGRHARPGYATANDYISDETGWWFSGLVDGEGCFYIGPRGCQFIINMRDDDAPMLEQVREQLGGIGRVVYGGGDPSATRKPQARLIVSRKDECVWLTRLFDAFPLRSKKARDYAVWREAAIDWQCGAPLAALEPYRAAIVKARTYKEPAAT